MPLPFFEKMEQIDSAIRRASDIEQMMSDVLQVTLDLFSADRVWILFPCDPNAASWHVPMERTQPEHPGAFALGKNIPMTPELQRVCEESLAQSDVISDVIIVDYRNKDTAQKTAKQFSMLSEMHMAIYPIVGKPWLFGMHQCSYYRHWTEEELSLFRWIGSRIADTLGSLLIYRDLQEREHFVRDLLDATTEAILGFDLDENCTFANEASAKLLGYQNTDELIGRKLKNTIYHTHSADSSTQLQPNRYSVSLQSGRDSHSDDLLLWRSDGSSFPVEYRSHPIYRNNELTGAVVTFWDITGRKQGEELILHQAHFDNLTDLPNRFLSLDRLSQLISEAKRNKTLVAVLFLDLDDFKKINDTMGHETGDLLLIEAGARLCAATRSSDTVGRLGGDEFIILLGGLNHAENASPVVENLLNRFRVPFSINGRELILTVSVGVSIYPHDGDSSSVLLRNADSAMYHAKDTGRNTYSYFTHSMNLEVSRRLAVEEQMHGALERGEFHVYYQVQINIHTSQIMGAEALLRWFNPALGTISPVEFIPIAEQTGLIIPLGKFIFEEAVAKTAQWQQNNDPEFRISVNLSPRQFRDPELLNYIKGVIKKSTVSAKQIALEITEGVLLGGHSYIKETLNAMHKFGLTLAMDDFGTGYSSLSYLREYPFNELKIDRSFINNITTNPSDYALINATISMAQALNLDVVAEGVETEEQFHCLEALGCNIGQGYLFGKPVSASEVVSLLECASYNFN